MTWSFGRQVSGEGTSGKASRVRLGESARNGRGPGEQRTECPTPGPVLLTTCGPVSLAHKQCRPLKGVLRRGSKFAQQVCTCVILNALLGLITNFNLGNVNLHR